MPYFEVELARIVRETSKVIVKCKSKEELVERLSDVYQIEDGKAEWDQDCDWGSDEGSHRIIGEVKNPFEYVEVERFIIDLDKDPVAELKRIDSYPGIEIKFGGEPDAFIIYAKLGGLWHIFDADREWIPHEECDGNASFFPSQQDALQVLELIPDELL